MMGIPIISRIYPRAFLPEDADAPYWKKMISSPFKQPPLQPTADDPLYVADDSGGRGTKIYVLDDSFDLGQPVGPLHEGPAIHCARFT
jgi:hypothetical protein